MLSRCDFTAADLSHANLRNADLSGAVLRDCALTGAELTGACVRFADFSGVDLRGRDLSGQDLTGANFRHALLSDVVLNGANLREVWRGRRARGTRCVGIPELQLAIGQSKSSHETSASSLCGWHARLSALWHQKLLQNREPKQLNPEDHLRFI